MKKIVAVDGPAGSGKSTIAKLLANRIGYTYLDTGSLYRAVTHFLMTRGITGKDVGRIQKVLTELKIELNKDKVLVNGEDVTEKLRTKEVAQEVANFAKNADVRKLVRGIQQKIAEKEMIIVDGRDIGTDVFPDAFCKFFLDASPDVRAKRRLSDMKEDSAGKSVKEVEEELKARDFADRTRTISPLRIPVDALVIDTSGLSIDQVMEQMVTYYNKRIHQVSDPSFSMQSEDSKLFMSALEGIEDKIKKNVSLEPGTLLKAKIIRVTANDIQLDVGQKRDGAIPAEELAKLDRSTLIPGNVIDVYVINSRPSLPQILVSKLEADKRGSLITVKELFEKGELVPGKVKESVRGGYLIDLMGAEAFCPLSEWDLRRGKEVAKGFESKFHIIEFKSDQKLIVSRRRYLEKHYAETRAGFFENHHEGDTVEGVVVSIADFGVFVELEEGVTAILRPKNAAWKRLEKLGDHFHRGDQVRGKIIHLDPENQKIEISKKDLEEDPLIVFSAEHPAGATVKGTVRHIESFGAFIEVAEGVEGLLHISEMSWTKRVDHPEEIIKIGDEVEVKILGIDIATRKVSLGLRQVMDNPWENLEQKYTEGTLVKAVVKSVLKNGIYLMVDGEYEGFIHVGDVSWTNDRTQVDTMFQEGQEIEAKVLSVNKKKKRIDLGLKQKTSNPWNDLIVNYGQGAVIQGKVARLTESGAVVEVGDGLEGFCHLSQLAREKVEKPEDAVKVGETYSFLIQLIDEAQKKISLSIREYYAREEKKEIEKYTSGNEAKSRITLGDLLNN